MNELDALLKELNDPRSSYTQSAIMNNPDMTGTPMFNNMKFQQQEPSPEQSPMKTPMKSPMNSNLGMNQYQQMMSPSLRNQQSTEMKSQQNIPYSSQKSNLNKLNSPSLNALNSPSINKTEEMKKSKSTPELSPPHTKSNSQGQKQVRKIICATCKGQIKGKVVSCLGKTWHPEHFICQAGCKKLLDPNRFFEKNNLPCCENCHRESFVPRCAYCGDVITEKCITALGTTWHTDHFFCCQCAVQFPAGSGFLEKDGKAYCERDYYRLFATRCGKCGEIIVGEYISALGKEWHNKCFTCKECGCSFPTESFYEYKGMPYCETHYHLKRGSLCSRCNKPIVGRCISASGKKYHPDHFTCVKCNKLLATGNMDDEYKEVNGHPFCGNCDTRIRF